MFIGEINIRTILIQQRLRSLHEQQPPLTNNTKALGITKIRRILNDLVARYSTYR
jgi:hypothetical protein